MKDVDIPPLATIQEWGRTDWEQYEPCLWGDSPSVSRVIETIIRAAGRELYWRGEENADSLRDFWYNPTKPILQRAFPDKKADPEFDFSRRMSQDLSKTLGELVKDGEITYRSLNILDESRERELHLDSPEADKILFVEKEAAYRKLRPLEDVYELSIVSGGGWQATALIEDLAHELDSGRDYTLYLLTDYDPTGWNIGHDFRRRSEQLGISIADVRRVGILPRQLDDETIRKQRFVPSFNSDDGRDWMERHAIEGRYGLEIEAVGDLNKKGEALRRIVVDELRHDINATARRRRDINRATAEGIERGVERVLDNIMYGLARALREAASETIRAQDGVESVECTYGEPSVQVDLNVADSGREHLPEPYDVADLHWGAADGDRPRPDSIPVSNFVADQLQEQIDTGGLDLSDHIDLDGGAG